jgi:Uma2 family endonuclease
MVHPLGEITVQDWLDEDPPSDGSKRELILGKIRVSPSASGEHDVICAELYSLFKSELRRAGCRGLHAAATINAKLSTARRTAVIPDAAILNKSVVGATFVPAEIELVVEVWSPGDSDDERWEKFEAYALAGIRYLWTVELTGPVVEAYELRGGRYRRAGILRAGTVGTITAAPVPMTFDPAELWPE